MSPVVVTRPAREGDVSAPSGGTLRYAEYGDTDGFPIVYCHGTPGSRLDRHPDPDTYDGFRLVAYDRPGYGGSDLRPGRDVASAAADAGALADALGFERFSVFGVSGGGPHALACAAHLRDRVARVAVRCGGAPSDDPDFDFLEGMAEINVREFTAAKESPDALAAMLDPYVKTAVKDPDAVLEEIAAELPESDREYLDRPDVREVIRESLVESVRQGARGWMDDDLAFAAPWGFDLADVQVEVRLWQGELDVLVPRAHGEYLARRLPRATFELVPGKGHWMPEHVPAALRWLSGGGEEIGARS